MIHPKTLVAALLGLLLAACSSSNAALTKSAGDRRSRNVRCVNRSTVITPIHPGDQPRTDGGVETVSPRGELETDAIGGCDTDEKTK